MTPRVELGVLRLVGASLPLVLALALGDSQGLGVSESLTELEADEEEAAALLVALPLGLPVSVCVGDSDRDTDGALEVEPELVAVLEACGDAASDSEAAVLTLVDLVLEGLPDTLAPRL